jgi:hypothetical protein
MRLASNDCNQRLVAVCALDRLCVGRCVDRILGTNHGAGLGILGSATAPEIIS